MRKILLFLLLIFSCALANAQNDTIRYVKPAKYGGAYANDGKSWEKAKDNIQDAINDLRTYMEQNGRHGGSVYVAEGTYEPSEGVEGGASGQLSTSFIIYEGIHVYGGFNPAHPEALPSQRKLVSDDRKDTIEIGALAAGNTSYIKWQMKYPTVLSGNHNKSAQSSFRWNATRKRYDTRFPGNSYHVVFFASNGFISDTNHPGYADTLKYEARLDGFTVQEGNASGATDVRQGGRDHTSMGGGIYMVKNSIVENCIVQRCQAAMRGGGVYMDGGGKLLHTLVRECQTLGSGVSGGMGGGVCIDNNGEVRRSWITRNVARMGGGAAIISYPEDHPRGAESTYRSGLFDPYIAATLVTNNTSTTEAGGIYLDRGGIINHVTVARNENAGRDISYGRTRYGRSGGVYIYGAGQVYNSVIWGNRCDANNDIQYAATTGVSIPAYVTLQQPFVGYTALNNLDITDFTGTVRLNAFSFETVNNDPTRSGNFTLFQNPPDDAGAGIGERRLSIWYPFSKTSLATKAVQLQADYSSQAFSVMSIAHQDFFDKAFEPICTLGAIETNIEDIETAMVAPANPEDGTTPIPTIFVNPDRVFNDPQQKSGASWDNPMENISEAIEYFREHPVNGKFQILVKQGTVTCAGIGAYYNPETSTQSVINLASIRMLPNLLLYGGFPSTARGVSTEGRNPKEYPTRISGDIISAGYQYNALHVVSFSQAHDAVLDGFQIYYGNARNTTSEALARGAGIVLGNQYYTQSERVNMTGNVVRNCVIANCTGVSGAAVFAGGSYAGKEGLVKAGLKMENCVINNNASTTSIVHASGDATIDMDHCTVIGNVGPLLVTSEYGGTEGTIHVNNSAFHGNSKTALSNINNISAADIPALVGGSKVSGSNNLIDSLYTHDYEGFDKVFGFNSAYTLSYPSFANPVRNVGVALNTADNTVYGGNADYTPLDMNPVVNRASVSNSDHTTWGHDLSVQVSRDYGGAPDVGALECHQASSDNTNGGQPTYGSVIYVRDYNTYDASGNVLTSDSVTTDRDGTTWARAINGNATYKSGNSSENGLQFAVDNAAATQNSDKPEVWVAEGIYTNKSTETINEQHYAYSMKDGVDVIGGFPKQGNPSMNERSPKRYVSVLQPQDEDPTAVGDSLIAKSSRSVARVLVQPNDFSKETKWDGFTIRYGYLHSAYRYDIKGNIGAIKTEKIGNAGGAGAYIMEKGVLENCELLHNAILVDPDREKDNVLFQIHETTGGGFHQAGAGVYITTTDTIHGEGGTLRNCVVAYNELIHKMAKLQGKSHPESAWMYGAGVYQNKGIIYNTIIHDNKMQVIKGSATNTDSEVNEVLVGAGAFLVNGQFYNNTIVNNTAQTFGFNGANSGEGGHNIHVVIPGVYVYNNITMYNSIVSDNTSSHNNTGRVQKFDIPVCAFMLSGNNNTARYTTASSRVRVHYSYINVEKSNRQGTDLCSANDKDENSNIYLDYNKSVKLDNPYTSNKIYDAKTYRLVSKSPCINEGTDAIDGVTIPSYDAAYADRVQDCAIDIGAYEFNGAELISPRERTEPHYYYDRNRQKQLETVNVADYFVNQNGNGDRSANSPANAACASKLQRVLDAAGRYKYLHPRTHVIVRLEALLDSAGYTPSRSASTVETETSNPRSYSIIVPMGVEVQGGWPTNKDFGIDSDGNLHGRDPINNVTRLTGEYVSGTENVHVYHVVTFTNKVFDENGEPNGQLLSDSIDTYIPDYHVPALNRDFDRAKLDGLYIEGGRATGTSDADQRGGAAVLPYFSHISDCIVRDNQATGYGGAFYMLAGSAIEGSVLESNSAAFGGAIAVAEADSGSSNNISSWALLLSNTVVRNNATSRGGGLWFNDNARTWNCVYWRNTSAEQNDISGITATSDEQNIVNCPVNFCAVTEQTLAGNNNISLSPTNENGVRWGKDVNLKQKHDYDYFLPSRASVLSRAGMPYDVMHTLLRYLPGIDSVDLAGVSRLEYTQADYDVCDTTYDGEKLAVKYNYNMDIGARALNQNFSITIDPKHPLYRLYVAHPENMRANLANALMESNDPVYKQQGSSFANPFLRLTDALNYVIDARKNYPSISQNERFEIFMASGTYYPIADMLGEQQSVRTHTFVVPEKVSIFGGIDARDSKNLYCQDKKDADKTVIIQSGDSTITLIAASTDSIRLKRQRFDLNQNSVVEPWEMRNATVLSGFSEGSDLRVQNVYHVITSVGDTTVVGKQPIMYDNNNKVVTNRNNESFASRGSRAIILDGLTITEGSATDYESSVRNHNMYFRGGGIFIAGNYLKESDAYVKGASDMRLGRRNIPLVISNSLFQNNRARQGGAIYTDGIMHVVGSSFVQNLAVSPSPTDTLDLKYVTFSGGGAIACNSNLFAANTIFANNEARDGGGTIVIDREGNDKRKNVSITQEVDKDNNPVTVTKDANSIRAYGGVIWAGDSAQVRLVNCNSVRNKAHAYASIYNCTPNTTASGAGHPHFGVNCLFWGNEVDKGQDQYLMNYNKASAIGGLYFSAYQEGKGLPATVTPGTPDSVFQKKPLLGGYGDIFKLDSILGHANHNVIINSDNDAVDGPNFTLPSNEAGIDGYLPSADWVPSRINALCDAGWGSMKQSTDGKFLTEYNVDLGKDTLFINGVYGMLADFYMREFNLTLLPQGSEKYMMYADESGDEGTRNMDRISSDPLGTVTRDYIDIGVYEYQHTLLHIANGDEVDELWVSDNETTGNNDGRSYDSPTSDLQRAIQTLLLSRNDHPKVIHMMEGTYSPIYEEDNNNIGFQIHTGPNASTVALRDTIRTGHGYQATSLTIMGGYSKEIENLRDVNLYPTILKMNRRDNASDANTAHLFYIGDAEQWETSGSVSGQTGDVAMTSNVTKTSVSHGKSMPIVFDGLTFVNPYANPKHRDLDADDKWVQSGGTATAGSAIYYREQYMSAQTSIVQGNNDVPGKSDKPLQSSAGAPKLTIRNCKFTGNGMRGTDDYTVPTVYIGAGGGKALIYNSLFDNNTGAPIVSTDTVNIVNCTFAENGGHITVKGKGVASTLSNSLIWHDDSAFAYKTQYVGLIADSLHNNAITGIENTDEAKNNHNVGLSDINADPMTGPNFANVPKNGGDRDFSLNPGMRTLGRADSTIYARQTSIIRQGVTDDAGRTVLPPDTTWRMDLAGGARFYGEGMERGAYECRVDQQRVLYVIPSKTVGTMNGTSWETAYGQGQLQTAIDAAAIYSYSHTNNDGKTMAYVLVKGEANNTSSENSISLRDGVSVFGSIPDNYLSNIAAGKAADNDTLDTYLKGMLAFRPGLAGRSTHRSRIAGIQTLDASYTNGALLDGFEVRSATPLTSAAVNITQPVTVRNVIVDGININGTGEPAVNMTQGLLYNSLIYGNKPSAGQPMVNLGAKAAVVNTTIVSEDSGVTAVSGSGFLVNSVTYNMADRNTSRSGSLVTDSVNTKQGIPFAPYLTEDVNAYDLPAFITGYMPYHYQLHEDSYSVAGGILLDKILEKAKEIQGNDADGVYKNISYAEAKGWIDFKTDRDLLGNNRLLGNNIDRGCFETWRIKDDNNIVATADNYPHEGSVVYIMDNATLSLGTGKGGQIFSDANPFRPAFLLMRPGASLYGNGNAIVLSYVAMDRKFTPTQKYALISLPFTYKVGDMLITSMYANGQIDAKLFKLDKAQIYDGSRRAAWDYHFSEDDSKCWTDLDTSTRLSPNTGWLATLPDHDNTITLRLVGYGEVDGDYVYTESGDAKTVTLTQHDNIPIDGTAHFTKQENMGWNLTGLPYLVSNYKLGSTSDGSQSEYAMNVPHLMYTFGGDGRFKDMQSWADDAEISTGDGFMTQTAVSGASETVTFALPVYDASPKEPVSSAKARIVVSNGSDTGDDLQLSVNGDAKALQYSFGNDGVKMLPLNKDSVSIYALAASGTPLSLSSATPTDVDIPVVVRGKLSGNTTVSIADSTGFGNVSHVWLKDDATGRVVDLKQEPMLLAADATDDVTASVRSLTLRLGDMSPDGKHQTDGSAVRIYLSGRTLHVEGLKPGDDVSIYTVSGMLYKRDKADNEAYSCELHQGVYVVRAGGRGQAVAVK